MIASYLQRLQSALSHRRQLAPQPGRRPIAGQGVPLPVSAWGVTRVLLLAVAGLTLAGVGEAFARHVWGFTHGWGLIPAFDLNQERSVPAWYASSTLFLAAVLLGAIAAEAGRTKQRGAAHWSLLSVVFVYLSIDEAISLHEPWMVPLRAWLGATGAFYYAWVIPGAGLLLLMGVGYAKFLLELPTKTRNLFLAAAALYIGGALGMEMVSGFHFSRVGHRDVLLTAMNTIEELLEMLGVVVFIHALLCHLGVRASPLRDVRSK